MNNDHAYLFQLIYLYGFLVMKISFSYRTETSYSFTAPLNWDLRLDEHDDDNILFYSLVVQACSAENTIHVSETLQVERC